MQYMTTLGTMSVESVDMLPHKNDLKVCMKTLSMSVRTADILIHKRGI